MRIINLNILIFALGNLFGQSNIDLIKKTDSICIDIDKLNLNSLYFHYEDLKKYYVFTDIEPSAFDIQSDSTTTRKLTYFILSNKFHHYIDFYLMDNLPIKVVEREENFPVMNDSTIIYTERNEVFRMNYYIRNWSENNYFITQTGKRIYSQFTGQISEFNFILRIWERLVYSKAIPSDNSH